MPMERRRYPPNWDEIAAKVKEEADWTCEECGKRCYRPGEPCPDRRYVLTVAHLDHTPENVDRSNLKALCSVCHLRLDARHHAETRRNRRLFGDAGQPPLF